MNKFVERIIQIGDFTCKSFGKPTDPAIVFLHAFPLDSQQWQAQVEEFHADYHVLVPDIYGFGQTPVRTGWSLNQAAEQLRAGLDREAINSVAMVGLSMGGYISLAFAAQFPDRLWALVLADTRAEADTLEAKANRQKAIDLVETSGTAALAQSMQNKVLGPTTRANRPAVATEFLRIATQQHPNGTIEAIKTLRDRSEATHHLPNIKTPTLVVVGEEDEVTPPRAAEAMVHALSQAHLCMLPGVGHITNLEDPQRFNEALRTFLDHHRPRG